VKRNGSVQHTAATTPEVVRVLTEAIDAWRAWPLPVSKAKPKRKRAVKPGWWFVENSSGKDCHVPGVSRERWFDARARAVAILSAKLKRTVSQDALAWHWVDAAEKGRTK
jgi:hypothetical protein